VDDLHPVVRRFLDAHIFSASQLEVLLLVRELDGEPCTLARLAQRTALPQSSLGPWLDAFVSRGLLARNDEAYRWAPHSADVADDVSVLAETWARRKTTVTRYIYAKNEDPLVRFADAFRFRRDDPRRGGPAGGPDPRDEGKG
jgi:hypothetical protein